MRVRWLGWAGVEIEADGARVVIDPLQDAGAVFAWVGDERFASVALPPVVAPSPGVAVAGLVTHLHRDHADADALSGALADGAPVYEPVSYGGAGLEQLAVMQADAELGAAGLSRWPLEAWSSVSVGPFELVALPAVDGTGDPQVSWLVRADGQQVIHLGDTMNHGWWWRVGERFGAPDLVCAPINGARLTFPHRVPASPFAGAMDGEQAGVAARLLGCERVLPMHYGGYDIPGVYEPVEDGLGMLAATGVEVQAVGVGGWLEL